MQLHTLIYFINSFMKDLDAQYCFQLEIPAGCKILVHHPATVAQFMPQTSFSDLLREQEVNSGDIAITFENGIFKVSIKTSLIKLKTNDAMSFVILSSGGKNEHSYQSGYLRPHADRMETVIENTEYLRGRELFCFIS